MVKGHPESIRDWSRKNEEGLPGTGRSHVLRVARAPGPER